MTGATEPSTTSVGSVTVRYWAAARAAAGVECDVVPVEGGTTLADVLATVRSLHGDSDRFDGVVAVCSVLVGDRPVRSADPAEVRVSPGDSVELLPPFAGG
jgi:molybdopterin converting factor small subunit